LINADGTDLRKLPWSDPVFKPGRLSWSPDGTRLALGLSYTASPMVQPVKMALLDLTGNVVGTSAEANGVVTDASWAPDSSRFAFAALVGDPSQTGVHVMSRDGTMVSYYRDAVSGGGNAAWSPDGQTILFPSSHELREITPAAALVQSLVVCPSRCIGATWSPDGNTIAVHNTVDLRLIDASGTLLSVIPAGSRNTPVWSPSGIYLAWRPDSGVTISHPDGSGAIIVNDDAQAHSPAWRP
jgi:Tol biopolymer transport system component